MKKIAFIFVTAFSVVLISCGGTDKPAENAPVLEEEIIIVEEPAAEENLTTEELFKQYQKTADELIPALLGMQKGETKAIRDYQRLSVEYTNLSEQLSRRMDELSEKDQKKFNEIADRIYRSSNPNAPAPDKK